MFAASIKWKENAVRWLRSPSSKKVLWFFIHIIQLAFALALVSGLSVLLLGAGESASKNHNSYCLEDDKDSRDGDLRGKHSGPCEYDYTFKKVIFMWLDGVSFDTAEPVFDRFPRNSNIFKVRHKENPWSAWVFATFMTGKPNRNMGVIKNDNLIYQFDRAGMKMRLGVEESVAYVGYALKEFVGDNIKFAPGVKNDDASNPHQLYDWFFKCGSQPTPELCVNATLNDLDDHDESLYLETFALDHKIHSGHSKYDDAIKEDLDKFTTNLQYIKNWVDDNKDYLLVMVSDHGQKTSSSDTLVHGDFLKEGNEGWMLVYNPKISTVITQPSSPIVLNTVDVLPTLWQFFAGNGVSIPAENTGVAYPVSVTAKTMYKMFTANANQMVKYAKQVRVYKDGVEEAIEKKLKSAKSNAKDGNYESAVVDMQMMLQNLSDDLFASYMGVDLTFPIVATVTSLTLALAIQFSFSRNGLMSSLRSIGVGMAFSAYFAWLAISSLFEHPRSIFENSTQVLAYAIAMFAFLASNMIAHLPSLASTPKGEEDASQSVSIELTDDTDCSENGYTVFSKDLSTVPLTSVTTDIPLNSSTDIPIDAPMELPTTTYTAIQDTTTTDDIATEPIYTCVHLIDNAKLRPLKDTLISYFNYIFGLHKTAPSPPEYWIRWFFVTFVCFAGCILAYPTKIFIFDDISKLHLHPKFWKTLVLFVAFLEFRWQRILLTTHLQVPIDTSRRFCWQLIHPAFFVLNLKTIVYFLFISLAMRSTIGHNFAFLLYIFLFAHIILLVFSPAHIQRDLALAVFTLLIFLSTPQERIYLSLFYINLHFISNTFNKKVCANQHLLPSLLLVMVLLTHFYFSVIGKSLYEIKLADSIPGIPDVTVYPILSVFLMGVHNFGYFLLLVPFIIRLVNAVPTFQLVTFKGRNVGYKVDESNSSQYLGYKSFAGTILLFFASTCIVFFFLFVKLRSLSDTCMLWAATTLIVCILYLVTLVGSEIFPMGKRLSVLILNGIRAIRRK